MKILIVDDNPINLKFLFYSLRNQYDIELAKNGVEALKITSNIKFDLIIMDLWMPIVDGAEATRQIRSLNSNSNKYTPIIFFTTSSSEDDKNRCLNFGADEYLVKPIDINLLKKRIEYHIEKQRKSQQFSSQK